jgi:hypothetical protein
MAHTLAGRVSAVASFAALYAFVDALLERRAAAGARAPGPEARAPWYPLVAGGLAGLGAGAPARRAGAGALAGLAVGAVAAPVAWALHGPGGAGARTVWGWLSAEGRGKEGGGGGGAVEAGEGGGGTGAADAVGSGGGGSGSGGAGHGDIAWGAVDGRCVRRGRS